MKTITDASTDGSLKVSRYQGMLVGLPGVNLGLVFLDRQAFGLLAPMIQFEFNLSNTELGMINGILAKTWAISSIAQTRAADITGRSKLLLMIASMGFSLATISSGLAVGLLTLMAARAVMGLAEGGLSPLSTHIISNEFDPNVGDWLSASCRLWGFRSFRYLAP